MSTSLESVFLSQEPNNSVMDQFGNYEDKIDLILKKLKDSDFISIFFLLMDFIPRTKYFDIINMDRSQKEITLKKVLKQTREAKETLCQILVILQKNNLLKFLNCCKHRMNNKGSFDKISPLWKVMYDVCELITSTKDLQTLKQLLPPEAKSCDSSEHVFIYAYNANIFSDRNLSELSNLFRNERQDISEILDMYNGKVCNIKYYPIRTPTKCLPCGLAIIINHEKFWSDQTEDIILKNREDSKLDVDALQKLWNMFGFETHVYENLTDKKVIDLFECLANKDHTAYDVFVACFLSHGADDVVFASNSRPISISHLVDIIANKCHTLMDKPKLFFIQACQGSQIQKGVFSKPIELPTLHTETTSKSNTPLNSDVLKVLASIPGYVSFVPPKKMSWFIQALVSKMREYGKDLDIFDIILKVQDEVSQKKGIVNLPNKRIENCMQTVILQSTLRRRLKLKLQI